MNFIQTNSVVYRRLPRYDDIAADIMPLRLVPERPARRLAATLLCCRKQWPSTAATLGVCGTTGSRTVRSSG